MAEERELGRLERVDLRKAWADEAREFTPWLAREDNLQLLAETVGLELELEATEKQIGSFFADILCKDAETGRWVLIENQLERTDHSHLGQIITYSAGIEPRAVIWIAQRFTDEHRAALDWLNENTGSDLNFFGLEIELWRIGSSPFAPKFNIVCQPNDWGKQVSSTVRSERPSDVEQLRLRFWEGFAEYRSSLKTLKLPRMGIQLSRQASATADRLSKSAYSGIPSGVSGVGLRATASVFALQDSKLRPEIRVELVFYKQVKHLYELFIENRGVIEELYNEDAVLWIGDSESEAPNRVSVIKSVAWSTDESAWPECHRWLAENLGKMQGLVKQYLK